jgi:hypothetical protein
VHLKPVKNVFGITENVLCVLIKPMKTYTTNGMINLPAAGPGTF